MPWNTLEQGLRTHVSFGFKGPLSLGGPSSTPVGNATVPCTVCCSGPGTGHCDHAQMSDSPALPFLLWCRGMHRTSV